MTALTDAQLNEIEQRPAGPSPQREVDINVLLVEVLRQRAEIERLTAGPTKAQVEVEK